MTSENKAIPTLPNESNIHPVKFVAINTVPLIVGTTVASLIFQVGSTEQYQSTIDIIATHDAGWLYLGLLIFGRTIWFLNFSTTLKYKMGVKGNLRTNTYFYKVIGKNAPEDVLVVLEEDGVLGQFNRSNRSVHNMMEAFGGFVASLVAVGIVFPFPTFVCVCIFCLGRILHQTGLRKGFGAHVKGFLISTFGIVIVEGMVAVVAMKSL